MAWGIWASIFVVLLILEMLTVDFTFTMVAGGALVATLSSALGAGLVVQVIAFAVVSTVLLILVRPWVRRHINNSSNNESNVYALTGQNATALTRVDATSGQVKIGGDTWSAVSSHEPIEAGTTVVITAVQGAQVVVVPA